MTYQVKKAGRRLVLMLAMLLPGLAQNAAAEGVRPFIIGGLAFGGDTLVHTTTEDLSAGGLIYFGLGVLVEPAESSLMYQLSLGYKLNAVEFKSPNGDASITTYPMDAIVFFKHDRFRIGGGATMYLNPKYELCLDSGGCATANFDDALGFLAEARYQINEKAFLGIRFTDAEYELGGESVDASNVQIHMGATLF